MTTLTPTQFTIARALARSYYHHWSWVPAGTYDLEKIEQWSAKHANTFPGINAPDVDNGWVIHTTGSGRLDWEISPSGTVILTIHRPDPVQDQINRAVSNKLDSNVIEWSGYDVAKTTITNAGDEQRYVFGEIIFDSSDDDLSDDDAVYDEAGQVIQGWNYNKDLRDDLLYERHVGALVRPLVTLLSLADPEPEYEEEAAKESNEIFVARNQRNHALAQEWRERVIVPAIARAKELLAPLFAIALPDPLFFEEGEQERPETYWTYQEVYERASGESFKVYEVHHRGTSVAVESERAATHMVLNLKANPELSLLEALNAASRSRLYRPIACKGE